MTSDPTSSFERRRAARVHVAIAIELRDARGFSLHSSKDLSTGGAFFDRAIPHAVGSIVRVSFKLPGDDVPLTCDGEVVNVPDLKEFGMGVRFSNLSESDLQRMEVFTREANRGETA
jgi:uncharacterized protein (TIGR02266 family)